MMGSIIEFPEDDLREFRRGLNELRRVLNDNDIYRYLIGDGLGVGYVKSIFVLSHYWNTLMTDNFPRLFDQRYFTQWVKKSGYRFYTRFIHTDDMDKETARASFELLRMVLNNKKLRNKLAKVGPCELTICSPCDFRRDGPSILVSNYVPGAFPNTDYSIGSDGHTRFIS